MTCCKICYKFTPASFCTQVLAQEFCRITKDFCRNRIQISVNQLIINKLQKHNFLINPLSNPRISHTFPFIRCLPGEKEPQSLTIPRPYLLSHHSHNIIPHGFIAPQLPLQLFGLFPNRGIDKDSTTGSLNLLGVTSSQAQSGSGPSVSLQRGCQRR